MQIYVHRNGEQLGPFTEAEIKSQLATGSISKQDLVWWDGQAGWLPLEQTILGSNPGGALPPPAPSAATPVTATTEAAPLSVVGRTSGMAIASLVCGISGLLIGITFIPAIVLGHLALGEIKRTPGLGGRGMAITGLVCGYFLPVLFVVIVAISVMLALGQTVHGVFSTINSQLEMQQGS